MSVHVLLFALYPFKTCGEEMKCLNLLGKLIRPKFLFKETPKLSVLNSILLYVLSTAFIVR